MTHATETRFFETKILMDEMKNISYIFGDVDPRRPKVAISITPNMK